MKWPEKILLILIAAGTLSCEKDENIEKNTQRIKEVLFTEEGLPYKKIVFNYTDEELSEILYYYKTPSGWSTDHQSIFYTEDDRYVHEYYFVRGDNFKYVNKNYLKIEHNRIVEDSYSIGSKNEWYPLMNYYYHYENNRLSSYNAFRLVEGSWRDRGTAYYYYDNSNVVDHYYYELVVNDIKLMDRDSFYWENGKLLHFVDYNRNNGEMVLNSRSDYYYDDLGRISQIDLFAYRREQWRPFRTINYEYDKEGYLVKEKVSWGYTVNYIYEPGNGNSSLLFYMPEQMIFNEPRFKNSYDLMILEDEYDQHPPIPGIISQQAIFPL